MSGYWPWWAGAIGLALVTIGYTLATDRAFGVSGAWDRVLHWNQERESARLRERDEVDRQALVDALAAAAPAGPTRPGPRHATPEKDPPSPPPRPAPLATQAALLISILVGGLVAAVASGRFAIRFDMGAGFDALVTGNPITMVVVLFVGGVLVGFGARLAGGCSSGHGLHGCGRLQPVSIVATAVFFGVAVLVSFLLWKVL